MSFILEALKKSESERQRQNGPALFEVKVAPPRSRFALWAAIFGALLLINGAGLGWVLMRGSTGTGRSAAAPMASSAPAAALPQGAPAAAYRAPGAQNGSTMAVTVPGNPPPANAAPAAAVAATMPLTPGVGSAPNAAAPVSSTAPVADAGAAQNADDLAPAVDPARASAGGTNAVAGTNAGATDGVIRGTSSGLPTYQDAAAARGANIPELRLDLHSYSSRPDERFIFLNMVKLHEGEALPQGVRVESITPDGVILSFQGSKFVLQRQ
jgi:general secretion pathway protein B